MLTLPMLFSVVAFTVAIGVFFFLWGRGTFAAPITTHPPVELPVVILTGSLRRNPKCGDKEFRGSVTVELFYLPSPNPNATVRVTVDIVRRQNCSVSLASTDVGVFSNDMDRVIDFSGELSVPCDDGDFTAIATVVNQGPGSTTIADSTRIDIDALPFTVAMPTTTSTSNGIDFNFDIKIDCCDDGLRNRIRFTNVSDVNSLDATPNGFTCGGAGDIDTIRIDGKKDDINKVGTFTVKAESIFGTCILGTVLVE
jgi:hypothetical protein